MYIRKYRVGTRQSSNIKITLRKRENQYSYQINYLANYTHIVIVQRKGSIVIIILTLNQINNFVPAVKWILVTQYLQSFRLTGFKLK